MHKYHIAYHVPSVGLVGDGAVDLSNPIGAEDLEEIRARLRREYGLTDKVEIYITFIFELRNEW